MVDQINQGAVEKQNHPQEREEGPHLSRSGRMIDSLLEGLQRERKGPYDKDLVATKSRRRSRRGSESR
jgi:hypothetical protein